MNNDIVTRLRAVLAVPNGVDIWTMTALQAADEIERLHRWKAEATAVIEQWDTVFDMVPHHPHDLGRSKSTIVADEIERLRVALESQTQWAELLAGNNCYCIPDDVGVCLPCAYRQTIRQNEEARRG